VDIYVARKLHLRQALAGRRYGRSSAVVPAGRPRAWITQARLTGVASSAEIDSFAGRSPQDASRIPDHNRTRWHIARDDTSRAHDSSLTDGDTA
jgi:hypothetical protein